MAQALKYDLHVLRDRSPARLLPECGALFQPGTFNDLWDTSVRPGCVHPQHLWLFVTDPLVLTRMDAISYVGKCAILGVEMSLSTAPAGLAEKLRGSLRWRQMCGAMVKQVMLQRGYYAAAQDIRLGKYSELFYKSILYAKPKRRS